jgi:hypothetical protein
VAALRWLAGGDRASAVEAADRAAAEAPEGLLALALAGYLRERAEDAAEVYADPVAFQAFISGGGNIDLYAAVSRTLAERYRQIHASNILDFGCGDGRAVYPAVATVDRAGLTLDLVEPGAALLAAAITRGRALTATVRHHRRTAQEFVATLAPDFAGWDVVEATFALSAIPPREADEVLARLRPYARRLVILEFDVPEFSEEGDGRLSYLVDRYERGLAEYAADRDLVARGFLLPVLVGQVEPGHPRSTWERPARDWAQVLRDAGYGSVAVEPVHDYWWAPAVAVSGIGGRGRDG